MGIKSYINSQPVKIVFLVAVSILAGSLLGSTAEYKTGLTILFIAGSLWVTELVPLPVTALLIPVLAAMLNIFDTRQAVSHFANPVIYVFVGGFTLAAVLNQHGLDKWLAGKVVAMAGGNRWLALTAIFGSVSFLSMWMSNTATTAMMLPIAMSLVGKDYPRARTLVIIGTAYSANIGGIATVIGSPPNLIAAAALDIDFATWIRYGLPVTLVMFPLLMIVLRVILKPEADFTLNTADSKTMIWSREKSSVLVFFVAVVLFWILSMPLGKLFKVDNFDAVVAIAATLMAPVFGLVPWGKLEKEINWGILLLFGGGLCLSAILTETGTSGMIARVLLEGYGGDSGLILVLIAVTFMVFLTEISSNTGAAAILVPIIMAIALQHDEAFTLPMVMGIGIAANCAFMLPVATPPNALAFSTGEISIRQMVKLGIYLNIIAIPVIWGIVTLLS
ncbi:MAG: SLC13/DASS family transporter [Bacteroidales bacterium]|nr:SLC13/DASS family transporter [Bacteroidales bacterium]